MSLGLRRKVKVSESTLVCTVVVLLITCTSTEIIVRSDMFRDKIFKVSPV